MAKTAILPPTGASLAQLAKIQGDDRCVLTLYFSGAAVRTKVAQSELAALPEKLLDAKGLSPDELEHCRHLNALWDSEIANLTLPAAASWMAVVSWLTEEVVVMQLPAPVEPAAFLDNSPFLLPAARVMDDFEAYAVVYADHSRATIYLAALGKVREEGKLRGNIKNHVRKGGWSQQRYERRRDKEIHHYCEAILEKLDNLVEDEGLRRIVLAGDRFLLNEIEKRMTAGTLKMLVARLPMEDKKTPAEVFEETLSAAAEEERREEKRLHAAITDASGSGGRAASGPKATYAALQEARVHRLLIGSLDGVDFWRCGACAAAGLGQSPACPDCGEKTYPQSAVNEFMDLAFTHGGSVEYAADENLADLGGVGALLRW